MPHDDRSQNPSNDFFAASPRYSFDWRSSIGYSSYKWNTYYILNAFRGSGGGAEAGTSRGALHTTDFKAFILTCYKPSSPGISLGRLIFSKHDVLRSGSLPDLDASG